MNGIARIAGASRRILDGFVLLGMLAATALGILGIAIFVGAISKLVHRNGGQPARTTSSSSPVPGPDASGERSRQ